MNTVASLRFVARGQEKFTYIINDYGIASTPIGEFADHDVMIEDGRYSNEIFELDTHGFALINQPTDFTDFNNEAAVIAYHYPEICQWLKNFCDARWVGVIDHTIRSSEEKIGIRHVAKHVHNDYTEKSLHERLRSHVGGKLAEDFLNHRILQINIWRPLVEVVKTSPLAIADGASVNIEDLLKCDLVYPDRVGEIYQLQYNPSHRWFYFSEMKSDEVLLIKGYDSYKDKAAQYAPHSAFKHPDTQATDPHRVSLEIRTIVVI